MSGGVELQDTADGVRLRLRVKPGSRRRRLVGEHGGALKLEVPAPPERGRANDALLELLAETLGLPRQAIAVTSGAASQDKAVTVSGVTLEDLGRRLRAAGIPVAGLRSGS